MGKSLIIPGADFSANKIQNTITWYISEAVELKEYLTRTFSSDLYTTLNIANAVKEKTVNCIRITKCETGTIKLYKANYPINGGNSEPVLMESINVNASYDTLIISLSQPIVLTSSDTILIEANEILYCISGESQYGSNVVISSSNVYSIANNFNHFSIDFGYIE